MANKLNAANSAADYLSKSKTAANNGQIESIKSITNLLLRKIEALETELPAAAEPFKRGSNLHDVITSFEKKIIRDALRATNCSQTRAAQVLGVKLTTLNAKMKRYRINVKSLNDFSAEQTSGK